MKPTLRIALLASLLVTGCSVINSPEELQPQPNECDGGACEAPADPCEDRCERPASCELQDGGAYCVCPAGFFDVGGDGSDCRPMFDCNDRECGPGGVCGLVGDGMACVCAEGYERVMPDEDCQNVNECARGEHDCDAHARCIDTNGGFECECEPGYRDGGEGGRRCEDVDECETLSCGEHAQCEFAPGQSECRCEPGYEGNPRAACADTDECANELLECPIQATCSDRPGPDRCVCRGYYSDVQGDGSECADERSMFELVHPFPLAYTAVAPPSSDGTGGGEERVAFAGEFIGQQTGLCGETLPGGGKYDVYVALVAADGSCLWERSFGTPETDGISDLGIDAEGNVLMLLFLSGALELDGQALAVEGAASCVLVKFDPAGTLAWSLRIPNRNCNVPSAYDGEFVVKPYWPDRMVIDRSGDTFLASWLKEAEHLGPLTFLEQDNGAELVARISSSGVPRWAVTLASETAGPFGTGTSLDRFTADFDGNSYVSLMTYGVVELAGMSVPGPGSFLLAFDSDGRPRWVRPIADAAERPIDLAADEDGVRLLLRGYDESAAANEAIVQALHPDGSESWRTRLGVGALEVRDIEIGSGGDSVVVGEASGDAVIVDETPETSSVSTTSLFVARIDREGAPLWGHFFFVDYSDVAASASGAIYIASSGYLVGLR